MTRKSRKTKCETPKGCPRQLWKKGARGDGLSFGIFQRTSHVV